MAPLPYHPSLPPKPSTGHPLPPRPIQHGHQHQQHQSISMTGSPSQLPQSAPHTAPSSPSPFMPSRHGSTRTPSGSFAPFNYGSPRQQGLYTSTSAPSGTAPTTTKQSQSSQAAPKWRPARLNTDDLQANVEHVDLGIGWKVYYRAWSAPPLLPNGARKMADVHVVKKTKTSGESTPTVSAASNEASPMPSTSKIPFSDLIAEHQSKDVQEDPVQVALKQLEEHRKSRSELERMFGLFPFVQLRNAQQASTTDAKGKAKEDSHVPGQIERTFWIFRIEHGTGDLGETERVRSRQLLGSIHFEGLTTIHQGAFMYADLYPSLYAGEKYTAPRDRKATQVPDATTLTEALVSKFATFPVNGDPLTVLLGAIRQEVTRDVLARANDCCPLGEQILLPSKDRFAQSDASGQQCALARFSFSLVRPGVRVFVSSQDTSLRPFAALQPLPAETEVTLAPLNCSATFVRELRMPDGFAAIDHATVVFIERIRTAWQSVLLHYGSKLADDEKWAIVRLRPATDSTAMDCVWPSSLIVVDSAAVKLPTSSPPHRTISSLNYRTTNERRLRARARLRPSLNHNLFKDSLSDALNRSTAIAERVSAESVQSKSKTDENRDPQEHEQARDGNAQGTLRIDKPASSVASAAPLYNTPLSLNTSSTEAPSPADNLVQSERNLLNFIAGLTSGDPIRPARTEADQLYPSPPQEAGARGDVKVSTTALDGDANMNEVAEDPFEFNWDDPFASNSLRPATSQPDFDDGGLMMGLTDDDFSFFDTPGQPNAALHPSGAFAANDVLDPPRSDAGPSTSMALTSKATPGSAASPSFIDHLAHMTSSTSFPSLTSPVPAGAAASPRMIHFGFDHGTPGVNNLGLISSTPLATAASEASPYKTPKTPYTPFLDILDDEAQSTAAGTPSVSLSLPTPTAGSQLGALHHRRSEFDPVHFGLSHAQADLKYDPRAGKFGLPTPESDCDSMGKPFTPKISKDGWLGAVCDPRYAGAKALKRKRLRALSRQKDARGISRMGKRSWRRIMATEDGLSTPDDTSDDDVTDGGELSDEDDTVDHFTGRQSRSSLKDLLVPSGASLVLLGQEFNRLLCEGFDVSQEAQDPANEGVVASPMPMDKPPTTDSAFEAAAQLHFDQACYNPVVRARLSDMRAWALTDLVDAPTLVSSAALTSAHSLLSATTDRLVASTLDETSSAKEDALVSLKTPAISMRVQQTIMRLDSTAKRFWQPMSFEPLSGSKDVTAFVVLEDHGAALNEAAKRWFQRVGQVYQAHRLGKHSPANNSDGICPLPVDSFSPTGPKEALRKLTIRIAETARSSKHTVVYLLIADVSLMSTAPAAHAFVMQQLQKATPGTVSLLLYPVPLSTLEQSFSNELGQVGRLTAKDVAFAVYDQLLVSVPKLRFPIPETFPSAPSLASLAGPATRLFQSPSFTLSSQRKTSVQFEYSWPSHNLEVLHRHRFLHVAYRVVRNSSATSSLQHANGTQDDSATGASARDQAGATSGTEWLHVAVIDEKGEMWKVFNKAFIGTNGLSKADMAKVIVQAVWGFARMVASTVDVEWRVAICKAGPISKEELSAWQAPLRDQTASTRRPFHVAIMCLDDLNEQSALSIIRQPSRQDVDKQTEIAGSTLPAHIDAAADWAVHTPSDPVKIVCSESLDTVHTSKASRSGNVRTSLTNDIVAPASMYLTNIPRISTLSHLVRYPTFLSTTIYDLEETPAPVNVVGVHVLACGAPKSSTYEGTLGEYMNELAQSYAELAVLGRTRWNTSGRIPWHIEAVHMTTQLVQK